MFSSFLTKKYGLIMTRAVYIFYRAPAAARNVQPVWIGLSLY